MEKAKTVPQSNLRYTSFLFVRMDDKFKHLMSNEKIALKQELETAVASVQDDVFLRTYSLAALQAGCDMLFWIIAQDVDALQKAWARISTTGVGKYFSVSLCYIGLIPIQETQKKDCEGGCVPKNMFGRHKYMQVHPLVRSHTWYELSETERQRFLNERTGVLNRFSSVTEHFFQSYGLDDQEHIVVRESNNLDVLAQASRELRELRIKMFTQLDTPYLLCIGRDLGDILDSLA